MESFHVACLIWATHFLYGDAFFSLNETFTEKSHFIEPLGVSVEGLPLLPIAMGCIFELMFISNSCEGLCTTHAVCTNALKILLNNLVYHFYTKSSFSFPQIWFSRSSKSKPAIVQWSAIGLGLHPQPQNLRMMYWEWPVLSVLEPKYYCIVLWKVQLCQLVYCRFC